MPSSINFLFMGARARQYSLIQDTKTNPINMTTYSKMSLQGESNVPCSIFLVLVYAIRLHSEPFFPIFTSRIDSDIILAC